MPEILFGQWDPVLTKISAALSQYEADHQGAHATLYRQNSVSVRIRIIDPSFSERGKADRGEQVWQYLRKLPRRVQSDISVLLLLTPDETQTSFANMDFDRPLPSTL